MELLNSNTLPSTLSSALNVANEDSYIADRIIDFSVNAPTQTTAASTDARTSSPLTPTLSLLVEFWEKLTEQCKELMDADRFSNVGPPATSAQLETVKSRPSRTEGREYTSDREKRRKSRQENNHSETNCELCGSVLVTPVTLHMRQAHPGCQKPALGLGYSPEGHYCGGWVGNCGEGGIQVSFFQLPSIGIL